MEALYGREGATANEILHSLPDSPSNATVRTLLRILEQKGFVSHEDVDGRFVYRTAVSRERAGRGALHRLVDTFFQGSIKDAVATLLDESDQPLSEHEVAELRNLIEARKEPE
jgi:predicted transcriptional regulator